MHKKPIKAKKKPKIAIIDSGAGGLSIVIEILNMIKHIEIFYLADKANFPYGEKDSQFLIEQLSKHVNTLIQDHQPDIIVLACNTASTIALEQLRLRFELPFIGVVPAIKPAASVSNTRSFALLATPNTVNTPYTKNLVNEFAKDCQVSYVGSTDFVSIAEQSVYGVKPNRETIQSILQQSFTGNARIDTLVLACTHFPLIKDDIENSAAKCLQDFRKAEEGHKKVCAVDSGNAIARRVRHILTEQHADQSPENKNNSLEFNNTASVAVSPSTITLLFTSSLKTQEKRNAQFLIDANAYKAFLLSKLLDKRILCKYELAAI